MTKKYYLNGTTKFYNDYFKSLDAKKYSQVRNNFTDSEDAFNYIGYQMGGWIVSECYKKVNKDNDINKLVEHIFSEIFKFTERSRDGQGYFLDRNNLPINVKTYMFNIVPKRLCNLNSLNKKDRNLAGKIRELWNKYYDITNEEIADILNIPLTKIDSVSEQMKGSLSLDYKNNEFDDISLYEKTPDTKDGYAEVDLSDLINRLIEIGKRIRTNHRMDELTETVLKDLIKKLNDGILIEDKNKNDEIIVEFDNKLVNGRKVDTDMVSDRRRKIQRWFREEMPEYKEYF